MQLFYFHVYKSCEFPSLFLSFCACVCVKTHVYMWNTMSNSWWVDERKMQALIKRGLKFSRNLNSYSSVLAELLRCIHNDCIGWGWGWGGCNVICPVCILNILVRCFTRPVWEWVFPTFRLGSWSLKEMKLITFWLITLLIDCLTVPSLMRSVRDLERYVSIVMFTFMLH